MKKTRIPMPLFQRDKDRERQIIGRPTLLETTYDQHTLLNARDLCDERGRPYNSRSFTHPNVDVPTTPYDQHALTPPPAPFAQKSRLSVAPTEGSMYSQGQSNRGYDYYDHPTATRQSGPSPPISPILEATSADHYSSRSISPIRTNTPPPAVYPRTPERFQSRWSMTTASPESTATRRSTAPLQSKFSPSSSIAASNRFTHQSLAPLPLKTPNSNTSQHFYSPQSSYSPVPLASQVLMNKRTRIVSSAESWLTTKSDLTTHTNLTTATTRKPVPQRMTSPTPSNATYATSKALPPPPMPLDPADFVAGLESRVDDLYVRERNVTRLIADIKSPKPQNPLHSDIAKRREEDKRLKDLEEELQEITYEKMQAGRELSHARSRRGKQDPNWGAECLWIQRVTS